MHPVQLLLTAIVALVHVIVDIKVVQFIWRQVQQPPPFPLVLLHQTIVLMEVVLLMNLAVLFILLWVLLQFQVVPSRPIILMILGVRFQLKIQHLEHLVFQNAPLMEITIAVVLVTVLPFTLPAAALELYKF